MVTLSNLTLQNEDINIRLTKEFNIGKECEKDKTNKDTYKTINKSLSKIYHDKREIPNITPLVAENRLNKRLERKKNTKSKYLKKIECVTNSKKSIGDDHSDFSSNVSVLRNSINEKPISRYVPKEVLSNKKKVSSNIKDSRETENLINTYNDPKIKIFNNIQTFKYEKFNTLSREVECLESFEHCNGLMTELILKTKQGTTTREMSRDKVNIEFSSVSNKAEKTEISQSSNDLNKPPLVFTKLTQRNCDKELESPQIYSDIDCEKITYKKKIGSVVSSAENYEKHSTIVKRNFSKINKNEPQLLVNKVNIRQSVTEATTVAQLARVRSRYFVENDLNSIGSKKANPKKCESKLPEIFFFNANSINSIAHKNQQNKQLKDKNTIHQNTNILDYIDNGFKNASKKKQNKIIRTNKSQGKILIGTNLKEKSTKVLKLDILENSSDIEVSVKNNKVDIENFKSKENFETKAVVNTSLVNNSLESLDRSETLISGYCSNSIDNDENTYYENSLSNENIQKPLHLIYNSNDGTEIINNYIMLNGLYYVDSIENPKPCAEKHTEGTDNSDIDIELVDHKSIPMSIKNEGSVSNQYINICSDSEKMSSQSDINKIIRNMNEFDTQYQLIKNISPKDEKIEICQDYKLNESELINITLSDCKKIDDCSKSNLHHLNTVRSKSSNKSESSFSSRNSSKNFGNSLKSYYSCNNENNSSEEFNNSYINNLSEDNLLLCSDINDIKNNNSTIDLNGIQTILSSTKEVNNLKDHSSDITFEQTDGYNISQNIVEPYKLSEVYTIYQNNHEESSIDEFPELKSQDIYMEIDQHKSVSTTPKVLEVNIINDKSLNSTNDLTSKKIDRTLKYEESDIESRTIDSEISPQRSSTSNRSIIASDLLQYINHRDSLQDSVPNFQQLECERKDMLISNSSIKIKSDSILLTLAYELLKKFIDNYSRQYLSVNKNIIQNELPSNYISNTITNINYTNDQSVLSDSSLSQIILPLKIPNLSLIGSYDNSYKTILNKKNKHKINNLRNIFNSDSSVLKKKESSEQKSNYLEKEIFHKNISSIRPSTVTRSLNKSVQEMVRKHNDLKYKDKLQRLNEPDSTNCLVKPKNGNRNDVNNLDTSTKNLENIVSVNKEEYLEDLDNSNITGSDSFSYYENIYKLPKLENSVKIAEQAILGKTKDSIENLEHPDANQKLININTNTINLRNVSPFRRSEKFSNTNQTICSIQHAITSELLELAKKDNNPALFENKLSSNSDKKQFNISYKDKADLDNKYQDPTSIANQLDCLVDNISSSFYEIKKQVNTENNSTENTRIPQVSNRRIFTTTKPNT